jgi:hypothetical protein
MDPQIAQKNRLQKKYIHKFSQIEKNSNCHKFLKIICVYLCFISLCKFVDPFFFNRSYSIIPFNTSAKRTSVKFTGG